MILSFVRFNKMESFFSNQILFGNNTLNSLHIFAGEWLDYAMVYASIIGYDISYILIVSIIYWCHDRSRAIKIGAILFISLSANEWLKIVFKNPRPASEGLLDEIQDLNARYRPSTNGFPSGHSQGAIALWLNMVYHIRNRNLIFFAAAMILIIPYSRIYLGVHFLGDILGGYLFGLICLAILIPAVKKAENFMLEADERLMVPSVIIIPFILCILFPSGHGAVYQGAFAGFAAGHILGMKRIDFNPAAGKAAAALKIFSGSLIILSTDYILRLAVLKNDLTGFARYMIIGFLTVFFVPYIFSKIKKINGNGRKNEL